MESEPVSRSPEPTPLTSLANQQIPELLRGRSEQAGTPAYLKLQQNEHPAQINLEVYQSINLYA